MTQKRLRRTILMIVLLLCGLLNGGKVSAQVTMYEGDPNREVKEDIEEIFGLYILNPSRRHGKEKILVKKDLVEMWLFYDQRRPSVERIKCYAYRWLLLGRYGNQQGVRTFFSKYSRFNKVDLIFYTLKSNRTLEKRGVYKVRKTPQRYLAARISRKRAGKLDWDALEKSLSIDGSKCAQAGEKAVDRKWYGKYLVKQ